MHKREVNSSYTRVVLRHYGVICGEGLLGKAVIKNLLPSDTVLWKENVNMAAA